MQGMGGVMVRCLLGAAMVALAFTAPAAAQDALVLEPSSDWSLDYAEDSCALRRTFGRGESQTWLEITQLTPGVTYRITVASSGLPMSRRRAPAVRFLPEDTESVYDLAAYGDYGEGFEGVAFYATIFPSAPEGVAEAQSNPKDQALDSSRAISKDKALVASQASTTAIEVRRAFDPPIVLRTGSLLRPLEAMHGCMDDLVSQWEITAGEGMSNSQPPVPRNMLSWAKPIMNFYPRGLVQFDGPSRILVRVIVGPDGKPEKCRVIEPVVNDDYQERTCGVVLSRGEYEPARDSNGNPVRGLLVQSIVYAMTH